MNHFSIKTQAGAFRADFTDQGLSRLHFPGTFEVTDPAPGSGEASLTRRWRQLTSEAVMAVLKGHRPGTLPPLDLGTATPFQRRVWALLRAIPPGQTLSYAAVAARAGSPKGSRAVGGACAANPLPLLIPCHRVLAANGRIGGFSGGIDWKRRLLTIEGVPVK